jgi:hypothetical protein
MKIPMWWTVGVQYAATSPLAYTLQYSNAYCHGGTVKENKYLFSCDLLQSKYDHTRTVDHVRKLIDYGHNIKDLHIVDNRYSLPIDNIWNSLNTVDKYINYYKSLWELIKNDYKSVADYSNLNQKLSDVFLDSVAPKLLEVFDIKVGIIVRDPIRRSWSQSNTLWENNNERIEFLPYDLSTKYIKLYNKFLKYFPTHIIVMEELWEGDGTEKEKLSEFIDYPLGNLYRNLYAPDRGHLQERDEILIDQYSSCFEELTPEIYAYARKKWAYVYDEWRERFGRLPLYWGEPLTYV